MDYKVMRELKQYIDTHDNLICEIEGHEYKLNGIPLFTVSENLLKAVYKTIHFKIVRKETND